MHFWPVFIPVILVVLLVIWAFTGGRRLVDQDMKIKQCLQYTDDVQLRIMKIQHRDACLKKAFVVEADRRVNLGYTPDQYIFTSATVGGVSTGGISKIDGGYNVSLGEKTGSYSLKCFYCPKGGMYDAANPQNNWAYINCITLSQEDFSAAKRDPKLAQFIVDEKVRAEFKKHGTKHFQKPQYIYPMGSVRLLTWNTWLSGWLVINDNIGREQNAPCRFYASNSPIYLRAAVLLMSLSLANGPSGTPAPTKQTSALETTDG